MKFEIGYHLICVKSIWISTASSFTRERLYTKGKTYKIIGKSTSNVFIIDDKGTKRPISITSNSYNSIRVYWKNNFKSRDYSLSQLLDI